MIRLVRVVATALAAAWSVYQVAMYATEVTNRSHP